MRIAMSFKSNQFNPSLPDKVKMVEVGPRDGLQNEARCLSSQQKLQFIQKLRLCGFKQIEVGSFVKKDLLPQMANSDEVLAHLPIHDDCQYSVLIPNQIGLNNALKHTVNHISVFISASEKFSQSNIHCTINESLQRIQPIVHQAIQLKIPVRAYISCVIACPYQGETDVNHVADLAQQLITMGCSEISLADTIGVGTPASVIRLLLKVKETTLIEKIAVHFHDSYGMALANIYAALQVGVKVIDSSVAGLGGCPYAKGSSGNVASEDVLYLLNGLGIETGVNLTPLIHCGENICQLLQRPNFSKVASALSHA